MKKILMTILSICYIANTYASNIDSTEVKESNIKVWQVNGPLAHAKSSTLDTMLNGCFITNPAYKRTIAFQHLGNLGSPGISKIYSDRKDRSEFLFFQPFSMYYKSIEDLLFFNTKRPYANISYFRGGPTNRKQENLNGIFTVNINPKFNMGMYGNWQNNYGAYNSQSAKNYNAGFFGSYLGDHNNLTAAISLNGYEVKENGGLTDETYITDPKNTGELDAYNLPTYFDDDVNSRLVNWNAFLNYKYNFGFYKTTKINEDSSTSVFIPVSSIIYTFKNERDYKRYKETAYALNGANAVDSFYINHKIGSNHLINNNGITDSTRFWQMSHTFGLSFNEEYNTLGKFGLAAYLSYDRKQYNTVAGIDKYIENPSIITQRNLILDSFGADSSGALGLKKWKKNVFEKIGLGAEITKHNGENLLFNFSGRYFFKDEKDKSGSYDFKGDISSRFKIKRNTFFITAKAEQKRSCPDYLEEHYFSNRLKWDNDFDYKTNTEFEGQVGIANMYLYKDSSTSFWSRLEPELGLSVKVNENLMKNYIYWNTEALPDQYTKTINVLNFTISEQLKIWYLHFDNDLTIQQTNADDDVLDLPLISLYSNLYIKTKPLFKVLTVQVGADMRYNTKYYAPSYMPATGMFYAQNNEQLGDYAYYDLYLSFHLKSFRVFLEYNHLNYIWTNKYNFLVTPGYPLDQNYLKFGISVNFDN